MPIKLIVAALIFAFTGASQAAEPAVKQLPSKSLAGKQVGAEDALGRTVFQALVGDIALQRGDIEMGVGAWADLAQRTRDPQVIARATEVAAFARKYDLAIELNKLWLEVDPESVKAQQTQSSLMVLSNRLDDLAPQLATVLEQDKASLPANLMHLNRMLARHGDKKAVQRLVDRLATPYNEVPEAHFAMGQAAANTSDFMRAQSEFEKALQLRPDWEPAALARAHLQARQSSQTAISSLSDFVERYPNARDARLALARLLISEKKYDTARTQFDRLIKDNPDNPEVIYPVAMLALQQGDSTTGRAQLEKLLKSDFPDKSTVHFFIGQIDEDQKQLEPALEHYRQVTVGDQYINARARAAQILLKLGRPDEAREMIHSTQASNNNERTQLILAESQLLREAGKHAEAYALLESALAKQPDNTELLYETALTAERLGKADVLEKHLMRLLEIKPDHAHALNAMGYSLAERNIRLNEAHQFITQALSLAPEDPFIMDSMGWVLYRQGKLNEALTTLENAYKLKADPEIAAHLGEVLSALNRKDDARLLLKNAAKKNPENEVLSSAIKKLKL
ncbi:MAG: tetratricopeptide repeat protein [Dechloromonas sp.]|uniref:Tetratricopeptide repeat protein n=1 Tax=Candidatus Dechloromonas phosphorivorans TaxID=2899244 RepID=A0A935K1V5_9RHOO|nr:tetratricopeptide repeat protein [Candidatus Dechloromonas phosphorivorans]